MQNRNGKVAALSSCISRATYKCIHFFDALKNEKGKFFWTNECEAIFQEFLEHHKLPSVLSKPLYREDLYLYLVVLVHALSATLVRKKIRSND